ncbi:MAG: MATE family efflux transporter [Firmicutes bacterium]|nr:MATE family efflux transporter [Bacillota bacterium]
MEHQIDRKQLYKTLAVVVLPISLQQLISSSLSLVDNLMIGSMGEAELAAVGLATQFYFIHWMMLFGFSSGCNTFLSQFYGTGDWKNFRKVVGFVILVALCGGTCFFLGALLFPTQIMSIFTDDPLTIQLGAQYIRTGSPCFLCIAINVPFTAALRVSEQATIPLRNSTIAFFGNTFLNYVFIFGKFGFPVMGVKGAALATVCCRIIEVSLTLFAVFVRKNKVAAPLKEFFGWNRNFVVRVVKNCIPTTINETMWAAATAAYNAAYGHLPVTAFAAVQAANTVLNMFTMAIYSLGDGMMILVGQELGRRKFERAYNLAKEIIKVSLGVAAFAGVLLFIMSGPISGLFNFTEEGLSLLRKILMVYSFTLILKLYDGIHITGTLRAGGDTKFAMFCELGTMWLVGVPLVFLGALYLGLPVYWVVLMSAMEEVVKAMILSWRFLSKKWVNNVIRGIESVDNL